MAVICCFHVLAALPSVFCTPNSVSKYLLSFSYSLKLFTSRLKAFMPAVLMNTIRTVDFFSVLSPFLTICSSYL